jgi:hypothetical protein
MKNLNVIVAFAADHLEREAYQATVEDRVDDLSKLSQRVHSGDELFKLWAEAKGGRAIAIGKGDGRIEIGADHLEELEQLKDQYDECVGSTCSVGVGVKLSEAEKALTVAQRKGGDRIELYTDETEQDLTDNPPPEETSQFYDTFFDKSEKFAKAVPGKNDDTRGGGMQGPAGPAEPSIDTPAGEASEHSENEALQNMMENQPTPPDVAGQFGQLAEQSEQKENEEKQAQADEQQAGEDDDNLRGAVVEVLKQFKEQAPLWEQLKEAQPEAYKTLTLTMQAMVGLARKAFMGEEGEGQEQPVQKSEMPPLAAPALHGNVETFLGAMKALPKVGPHRGKFITQHMNHGPFLQALQAHPQGRQVYGMLNTFLNSKTNAGVGVGAHAMAKALPKGAKLPLKPGGAIGDQTENHANQTAFPGSKEHAVATDALGGAEEVEYPISEEGDRKADWYGYHPLNDMDLHMKLNGVRQFNADQSKGKMEREPTTYPDMHAEKQYWDDVNDAVKLRSPIFKWNGSTGQVTRNGIPVNKAALEPGKTGRHQVVLPVGSQIDPSPSAGRNVSRIKILNRDNGKTKWRQVRAGMVMDPAGNPTSSRNPSGGVKQ